MKRMQYRKRPLPPIGEMLQEANRIYQYDSENGGLVWKAFKNPAHPGMAKIGASVGGDDGSGYKMCMLLGHKFKVHQIVWMMQTGEFPKMLIDHIDRNPLNNNIENLRLATDAQNLANCATVCAPMAGVRKDPKGHGYRADISINRKKKFIGYFKTAEEAHAAYVQATREARGAFSPI